MRRRTLSTELSKVANFSSVYSPIINGFAACVLVQINVDISRDEAEPDTSVDISFEAKPNSYIGVTGIDQSVLLLKTGNDISHVSRRCPFSHADHNNL